MVSRWIPLNVQAISAKIKTISAERLSNKYKNKVTRGALIPINILNTVKKTLSILLAPTLTPREKTEFEAIDILIKDHVSSK